MRILFIGEYSRLHNSLKEALQILGHEAVIVGNGDGFKNFPVDHNIDARWSKSKILNPFRQVISRVFGYDFATLEYGLRFYFLLPKLKGFDVVQLVSETPIRTNLSFEFRLLRKINEQNPNLYILCSGTDVPFMKAIADKKYRYSLLDPYLENKSLRDEYSFALRQYDNDYLKHHDNIYSLANGIIATDLDYAIAMENDQKFIGLIANPVNIEKIQYKPAEINRKIIVFHGINRWNFHKKGSRYFVEALKIIRGKYPEKVTIIESDTLPYDEYIKLYDSAHIVLDQVYAYDQGYNALEAMSKGKVVFTGAEAEFYEFYKLKEEVAINALPNVNDIVEKLSRLIEEPSLILKISANAREFICREHNYLKIAQQYIEAWSK